jgi:hypothetical protein
LHTLAFLFRSQFSPGLGTSQKALYVKGLKANLLSISQFCDNDLVVQSSKK